MIMIIITYIYNALNDALSASRIRNMLKTILSKYIHIQNSPSVLTVLPNIIIRHTQSNLTKSRYTHTVT